MLWLFKTNFVDFVCFLSMVIQVTYVVLYTQCLRYNIYGVWFLDIRISTCFYPIWYYRVKYIKIQYYEYNQSD